MVITHAYPWLATVLFGSKPSDQRLAKISTHYGGSICLQLGRERVAVQDVYFVLKVYEDHDLENLWVPHLVRCMHGLCMFWPQDGVGYYKVSTSLWSLGIKFLQVSSSLEFLLGVFLFLVLCYWFSIHIIFTFGYLLLWVLGYWTVNWNVHNFF